MLDHQSNWHRQTGRTGDNFADFFSISAHEFGHAAGHISHFTHSEGLCGHNNINRETMCVSTRDGQERWRTLEAHEIHTFNTVYEPR